MISRLIIALSIALFFTPARPLLAAEHPRPQLQQLPQITTRPTQSGIQTKEVSKTDISSGIKKHIASDTKKSTDRKFHVKYGGKDLALDLIKVHDDRLSSLGGGKYFACVDMKGTDGKIYDIDFLMTVQSDKLTVTQTSVHKINGKALYNWKQEGGIWKKVKLS